MNPIEPERVKLGVLAKLGVDGCAELLQAVSVFGDERQQAIALAVLDDFYRALTRLRSLSKPEQLGGQKSIGVPT